MSIIKKLAENAADAKLLEDMIVETVFNAVQIHNKNNTLGLDEALHTASTNRQTPGKRDVIIQVDKAGIKPFVVTGEMGGMTIAKNPKDGETMKFPTAHLVSGANTSISNVKAAAQRLSAKMQATNPDVQIWVAGDQRAKSDKQGGKRTRQRMIATSPKYDNDGNIKFEPQPEFRGVGGENRDARA